MLRSSALINSIRKRNKVLVIVGPTASGKSDLAVKLAQKFKGEVISADSRQVYKGLNIGTGKITKREMRGVPHHLLDVVEPKRLFTVADFVKAANQSIDMIYHINHLPIVVGGTGFYIDALAGKIPLPEVPQNKLLRNKLDKLDKKKLFEILRKKDPQRAQTIDQNNKVRLIRALEIIEAMGKVPKTAHHSQPTTCNFEYIGLMPDNLEVRIKARLIKRLPGMIPEARKLIKLKKLSYRRMNELGLEYRFLAQYLQGKITKEEMVAKLNIAIRQYAKRQMTWFKRNKNIKWFTLSSIEGLSQRDYRAIEKYVKVLLDNGGKLG